MATKNMWISLKTKSMEKQLNFGQSIQDECIYITSMLEREGDFDLSVCIVYQNLPVSFLISTNMHIGQ